MKHIDLAGKNAPRIAIVHAEWHADIVGSARGSLRMELERLGLPGDHIDEFQVPGAFELPLHALRLAQTRCYDGVVACGFVVDGGIYRHEFVASAVIDGLMRAQMETGVPVLSLVLTPLNFHEHEEHQRFFLEHMVSKGAEAARACLKTIHSLRGIGSADLVEDGR